MRSRRAATVTPPLRADDERAGRRDGSVPFPPPELPSFTGTMGQSDFLTAICLPRFCSSSGILADRSDPPSGSKSCEDLPGFRDGILVSATWSPTPGARSLLAKARCPVLPSARPSASARSIRYVISGLNTVHSWSATSVAVRPRSLPVYASTSRLPDSLQHSIRGGWLTLTSAGIPPACHHGLSRPHRPRYVGCRVLVSQSRVPLHFRAGPTLHQQVRLRQE